MQFGHHGADVTGGGDEEHLVIRFDDGGALGADGAALAEDGGHPGLDVRHVIPQGGEGIAHQRAAVVGLDGHQTHLATSKVNYLQRARILDEATHIVGHQLLGGDQVIYRHGFRQEQAIPFHQIGGGADASHLVRGVEQGVGHLTGDHVGLVTVGDCDQHVRILGPRLAQHPGVGAVAVHHPQVELVLQLPQAVAVGVDYGDVVVLTGEVFRQRATHLTCAKNDDFHREILPKVASKRGRQIRRPDPLSAAYCLISLA